MLTRREVSGRPMKEGDWEVSSTRKSPLIFAALRRSLSRGKNRKGSIPVLPTMLI